MGNTTDQWGHYNDIIFLSDPQNVYIVYEKESTSSTMISLIDPDTLEIQKTWELGKNKKSYGRIFIFDQVVYATEHFHTSPTKIILAYNLITSKLINDERIFKEFPNVGGYGNSLHFNFHRNELWEIQGEKFTRYEVKFVE